jgi:ribonucleoside-diphosphate reductase alpha chain
VVSFTKSQTEVRNSDGSVVFRLENVKVPDTAALADLPESERYVGELSAKQVFDRLAGCWTYWGSKGGYFSSEEDARVLRRMRYMLAKQTVAPNSPQWFNTGLHWAYGVDGPGQGHYYVDWKTRKLTKSKSAYEHPQPHACFIQDIEDDLVNERGIMDLWVREARLFKYGSGTGSNFSRLRGEGERLSGGGRSSGLMSFLKIGDRAAGAIKSGGTTRRAAKMVVVDADHISRPLPPRAGHRGSADRHHWVATRPNKIKNGVMGTNVSHCKFVTSQYIPL